MTTEKTAAASAGHNEVVALSFDENAAQAIFEEMRHIPVDGYRRALEEGAWNWRENMSQRGWDIVGADWGGTHLTNEQIDELLLGIDFDSSMQYPLLSFSAIQADTIFEVEWKQSRYCFPNEIDKKHIPADESVIGQEYTLWLYRCYNCGDATCDFERCMEDAFVDTEDELVQGITFDSLNERQPQIENDALRAVAEEIVPREVFNASIAESYERFHPGAKIEDDVFVLTYGEPTDGKVRVREGFFQVKKPYAKAVSIALNEIAKALDNGEYAVEKN